MKRKVKIGISACLLGENVRYDGGNRFDAGLAQALGPLVTWVPVCPEVEAGLGVPREPMHLVGSSGGTRLVTIKTGLDHTELMEEWAARRLGELGGEKLSGFIFKSRSPSCALTAVEVEGMAAESLSVEGAGTESLAFEGAASGTSPGLWASATRCSRRGPSSTTTS